jgi:hypothetical protein
MQRLPCGHLLPGRHGELYDLHCGDLVRCGREFMHPVRRQHLLCVLRGDKLCHLSQLYSRQLQPRWSYLLQSLQRPLRYLQRDRNLLRDLSKRLLQER